MDKIKSFQQQNDELRQFQKLSQNQIQALSFISLSSEKLREIILNEVKENPALEIVNDPLKYSNQYINNTSSKEDLNTIIENKKDETETLQNYLLKQLNYLNLPEAEYAICKKLILNLDDEGFYGNRIAPVNFLDKSNPLHTKELLKKCIFTVQKLNPIGTCCKDIFESLKIQAIIKGNASKLTLFILDGHLDLIDSNDDEKTVYNIKKFIQDWHSKAFAQELSIDNIKITKETVVQTLDYIRALNPHPASDFNKETNNDNREQIDVVMIAEKKKGVVVDDDYISGIIKCNNTEYIQITYSNGFLPEIKILKEAIYNKKLFNKAKDFLWLLDFRKNTIIMQGCAIVKNQIDFFTKGPGNLKPLTRKQIAEQLNVNTSTISRFTSKKYKKYIQTQWGTFSLDYFFTSGVHSENGKLSSEKIKSMINKYISSVENQKCSDLQISEYLQSKGINISRRTITKYRHQMGVLNSYNRQN